jgi:hypothetical protein
LKGVPNVIEKKMIEEEPGEMSSMEFSNTNGQQLWCVLFLPIIAKRGPEGRKEKISLALEEVNWRAEKNTRVARLQVGCNLRGRNKDDSKKKKFGKINKWHTRA